MGDSQFFYQPSQHSAALGAREGTPGNIGRLLLMVRPVVSLAREQCPTVGCVWHQRAVELYGVEYRMDYATDPW